MGKYKGLPRMSLRQRISYTARLGIYKNRESRESSEEDEDLDDEKMENKIQELSKIHPEKVTELQSSQWNEMRQLYDERTKEDKEEWEKNLEKMQNTHNKDLLSLLLKQQVERDPVINNIAIVDHIDNN